jgi:hypothetical protein
MYVCVILSKNRKRALAKRNPEKKPIRDLKTTFAVSFAGMYKIKKKRSILRFFFPFALNVDKI